MGDTPRCMQIHDDGEEEGTEEEEEGKKWPKAIICWWCRSSKCPTWELIELFDAYDWGGEERHLNWACQHYPKNFDFTLDMRHIQWFIDAHRCMQCTVNYLEISGLRAILMK